MFQVQVMTGFYFNVGHILFTVAESTLACTFIQAVYYSTILGYFT